MLMTMSLLTLTFSGLLILAGLHVGNARGVQQWALGSLCISVGLASTYIQDGPTYNTWFLIFAATLLAGGLGLQFNGIQIFKTGRCNKHIPWLLAGLMFMQNTWFVVVDPDIHARVIVNSLLYALGNAVCARALLIKAEQPLRTVYWFTGASFAIFAISLLARTIMIFNAQPDTYSIYSPIAFNTASVFIGIMSEMCVTFGFVLMLNSRLAAELQKLALLDPLTGALNRRSLEQEADRLSARCTRTGDTMAVMMIDVDNFKSINDRYGHPVGDAVLIHLAEVAQKTIRRDDYFARYGGEEFCILLPSTSEKDACILAERLRQTYADMMIKFDGKILHSTISIGVSDSLHIGVEFTLLIAAADQAMYIAKQEGRNRVMLHSSCLSQVAV